jgi:hypothetical protein
VIQLHLMQLLLRQTRELSFTAADGEPIDFRIEVFEHDEAPVDESRFRVRVWVYELVRLHVPFSRSAGEDYTDSTVLVLSDLFDGFEHHGGTVDIAADACIAMMRERLGGQ